MYAFNHVASFYYQKFLAAMADGHYDDANKFGETNLAFIMVCSDYDPELFAFQYLLLKSNGYKCNSETCNS